LCDGSIKVWDGRSTVGGYLIDCNGLITGRLLYVLSEVVVHTEQPACMAVC